MPQAQKLQSEKPREFALPSSLAWFTAAGKCATDNEEVMSFSFNDLRAIYRRNKRRSALGNGAPSMKCLRQGQSSEA
jgi:hypothetical protein